MDQWSERYSHSLMNTFGSPQRVLARGQGVHVWDIDGKQYTDLLAGIAVNVLGHAHPELVRTVHEQFSTLGHISNFFASEPQIRLAERLLTMFDRPGRVFFANSGSEANETALKLTRRTGRSTIVAAAGSFHGRTMGALALTSKAAYREPFEPLPGNVTWVPYDDIEALRDAVTDDTAAVLLETIQGEAGVHVASPEYLAAARDIATEHGALLWFDEIQSGMGRTGVWFDHQHHGVVPDIMTLAKGLAGGFPIGACIAAEPYAELFQPGNHGTTFGGNPMAAACALTVIDTIESEDLMTRVVHSGETLAAHISTHDLVTGVTGRGLLRGVVLAEPVSAHVVRRALDAGLIVNAPTPDRIRLAPPLILTEQQARAAAATLTTVFDDVVQHDMEAQ